MLTDAETAKLDHFQTQASAIVRRLTFESNHTVDMERGAIDALQNIYNAYPDPVKKAIRAEILPRVRVHFELVTGFKTCPHCIKGMVSPDENHEIPKVDAAGNQVYEDVLEDVEDETGQPLRDGEGKIVQRVIGQKPVMLPIAHEKQPCKVCNGTGELPDDGAQEPVEMTPEEIEAKFGVKVKK